jgi:exopolysaccharide production protein ExoQ
MGLHFSPIIGSTIGLPPQIALFATVAFVFFLFRRDVRQRPNISSALWLPFVWLLLIGSRSVVLWLHALGITKAGSVEEGNPLDALVYFSLIVAGIYVLNQRGVSFSEVLRNNGWLIAFIGYCFIAIFWSEFPFIAFKRWIKILGHPIMVLIILTEPDPGETLSRLVKRAAYVLLPFSICLIKYYPNIGRGFDDFGNATNNGVTHGKNQLGLLCLFLGFFLLWHWLKIWRAEKNKARRDELILTGGLFLMIAWLFSKAHSATSFLSFLIAVAVVLLVGRQWISKNLIGTYVLLAVVAFAVADSIFGILEHLVALTGHGATLTGRMELWRQLLAYDVNPVFGVGFESFWLGDRIEVFQEGRPWTPNEAHNGYLETYLNLGLVGLFMLIGLIVATFRKIKHELLLNPDWGRFRLGLLTAVVFYNWTEVSFRGLSLLWFAFYIIALEYPYLPLGAREPSPKPVRPEKEPVGTEVYV